MPENLAALENAAEIEIEVNEKQAVFLAAVTTHHYKIAAMIGGRGGGKSVTMADYLMYAMEDLPKARCGWGVKTVKKGKAKLTAGLKARWKKWGLTEYDFKTCVGCFVLWREPPPHFERPHESPDNWENVISFPNGFVIEMEGFLLGGDENRGSNYDLYIIDEGLNFREAWLKVVLPTLRANVGKYDSALHHTLAVFSSPPWTPDAAWLHSVEEWAKQEPGNYFYLEIMTRDNMAFLPADYIDTLRKSLQKLVFEVEVEGKRISRLANGFYPSFQHERHVVSDEHETEDFTVYKGKAFYDRGAAIDLSIDFNAHFTSLTAWQVQGREARNIDGLHVKETDPGFTMSETLAHKFATEYAGHGNKTVTLVGDRNGANKSAGSTKSMFQQFADVLKAAGWKVRTSPLKTNPGHYDKYVKINDILSGKDARYVLLFDGIRCKSVIISITSSPVTRGFEKDKSSESSSMEQERATHYSDTVDYYVLWLLKGGRQESAGDFDIQMM
ncbi:hypothetical protein FAES_3747 [Fibrella aestuarina BUZ 2]|uniref:Terminase n=1 Tax=Fibrella aestuarina BUZ 2 TaxID=1166018 RepID=I0KCA1_9BACT|nr:hypothetical protein [Fibrella aestuarina]CCH01754.1 hypothetical protein FAES_3747 [Fibrella aestuarina BUZ 2]